MKKMVSTRLAGILWISARLVTVGVLVLGALNIGVGAGGGPQKVYAASGGPDASDPFGYRWIDNTAGSSVPTYSQDGGPAGLVSSGTAVSVTLGNEQTSGAINLPFSFTFYGQVYTTTYINSNGFISFLPIGNGPYFASSPLPSNNNPKAIVAAWWANLDPSLGGSIYYDVQGTAPYRRFIIEFYDVPHNNLGTPVAPVTFQIKLFETYNIIEIHYLHARTDGTNHTAGIQNEQASVALQYFRGTGIIADYTAVRFTPSAPQVDLNGTDPGANFSTYFQEDAGSVYATGQTSATVTELDGSKLVPDLDGQLVYLVAQITNPMDGAAEVLTATTLNLNPPITATYSSQLSRLTLTGAAPASSYETVLRSVTYENTSHNPTVVPTRTITFVAFDGFRTSQVVTASVAITAVNEAPVNTVPHVVQSAYENQPFVFSAARGNPISVSDLDVGNNPVMVTLTVSGGGSYLTLPITTSLGFVTGDGVADSTMTFTGTLPAVNAALDGLTFLWPSELLTQGMATLQITTNDQGYTGIPGPLSATNVVTLTIQPVNDPPVIDLNGPAVGITYTTVFTEKGGAIGLVDAGATISDPDSLNLNWLIVKNTNCSTSCPNGTAEVLSAAPTAPIVSSYDAAKGELRLSGKASLAAYQATLRTVTYNNRSDAPDITPRLVSFVASDDGGVACSPVTTTVTISAINDPPLIQVPGAQTTWQNTSLPFSTVQGNPIAIYDDAGPFPVQVNLTATTGTLTLASVVGLTFITGSGLGDPTLAFTGTVSAINLALDGLSFAPTLDYTGTAGLDLLVDDLGNTGSGGPLTATGHVTITVLPATVINLPPMVDLNGPAAGLNYATAFTGTTAFAAANTATITDADSSSLASMVVTLSPHPDGANEKLMADITGTPITVTYNSGTGSLFLGGTASINDYQTVLRTVVYSNTSATPDATTRLITFVANDGTSASIPVTTTLTINTALPQIDLNGPLGTGITFTTQFTEQGGPVALIDPTATLTDPNGLDLSLLVVRNMNCATGCPDGSAEVLSATVIGPINQYYDASIGQLLLFGQAPAATYQQVLQTVMYNNTSAAPNTTPRLISFMATDTANKTNAPVTTTVTIVDVNSPPAIQVPGAQTTYQSTPLVFAAANANAVAVSDPDAGVNPVWVTLTATNGTLTLASVVGLTFSIGDGQSDATLSFQGSLAAVNTALEGLSFTPTPAYLGSATLDIGVNDMGNTGALGGPQSASAQVAITVQASPVKLPPWVDLNGPATGVTYTTTYTGTPVLVEASTATITSTSSASLSSMVITLSPLPDKSQEKLVVDVTRTPNIRSDYNALTGQLTLLGTDLLTTYQSVLRTVAYTSTAPAPTNGPRLITFVANDGLLSSAPVTTTLTVKVVGKVYLPMVTNIAVSAPDLVGSFTLSPKQTAFSSSTTVVVTVLVTNTGTIATSSTGFWVDFYINPSTPPTAANQTWDTRCGSLLPCYGISWHVTQSLQPGQSVQLTSTPDSYASTYTNWPGHFAAGTTDLYVYVDSSSDTGQAYGNILESNESNNRSEMHGLSVAGFNLIEAEPWQPVFPRR